MKRLFLVTALLSLFTVFSWSQTPAAPASAAEPAALPQLVAHRGGKAEADENTIPAFKSALEAGITGYELDIHITSDGQFVIMHDNCPRRTTGSGGLLENMTLSQVHELRTLQGNKVPTLEEVVELFNRYEGLYVEFEMKTTRAELYPREVLEKYVEGVYARVYKNKPASSAYIFTSFDTRSLSMMHERHPDAEIMYITSGGGLERMMGIADALGTKRFACNRSKITQNEIAEAHKKGYIVSLWPNVKPEDFMLSFLLGADIICTDIPREMSAIIGSHNLPVRR